MVLLDRTTQKNLKILTAGNNSGYSHGVSQVLEQLNIDYIHAPDAEAALGHIDACPNTFAVIISDPDLSDMSGVAFLSDVKSKNPSILRYLVSDSINIDLLSLAVNDAGIHQYIQAPFTPEDLAEKIRQGLTRHEQNIERRRIFNLARKQNGRLYELNCELIETVKSREKELDRLEKQTGKPTGRIEDKNLERPLSPSKLTEAVKKELNSLKSDYTRELGQLYEKIIAALYTDFNDFALGNGIEIAYPREMMQQSRIAPPHDAGLTDESTETGKGDQNA